jgi:hypothetical protein
MTTIGDVLRQIDTLKQDRQFPPTTRQQETFERIICTVSATSAGYKRSR